MFDFGIFCHLLRLMGLYRVGAPSGYLKSIVLSFSFLPFFLFRFRFFIFFFVSLSVAPLAPGPLDIVHPCHPVATPLYSKHELRKMNWLLNRDSKEYNKIRYHQTEQAIQKAYIWCKTYPDFHSEIGKILSVY